MSTAGVREGKHAPSLDKHLIKPRTASLWSVISITPESHQTALIQKVHTSRAVSQTLIVKIVDNVLN